MEPSTRMAWKSHPGPRIYTSSNFADERQVQYFGKLTYLFNQDHRLALSVAGTPARSGGANAYSFSATQPGVPVSFGTTPGSPGTFFRQTFDGNFDLVLKLSSSFAEKRVLLDVTAGWHHEDHNLVPADGSKIRLEGSGRSRQPALHPLGTKPVAHRVRKPTFGGGDGLSLRQSRREEPLSRDL